MVPPVSERKRRILAVDDNDIIGAMLRLLLAKFGYEGLSAVDGIDALAQLRFQDVDLILLDLDMPRMGGIEMLKVLALNEKLRNIPVVVMTGSGRSGAAESAVKMGAREVIEKPFESKVLRDTIHRYLTGP